MFAASQRITIADAQSLPLWRRPETMLIVMAAGMPLAFATWMALINNFVVEIGGFDGSQRGWQETIREIPGFLALGVIVLLWALREQTLALASLALLGVGVAITGYFPTFFGVAMTTLIGSIGFHYFETVNQSLQLQWIDKRRAPQVIGWIVSAGAFGSLIVYAAIVGAWTAFELSYQTVFLAGGLATLAIALLCALAFPSFEAPTPQRRGVVLRKRYWLYYALVFMGGARRQIFLVFAAFMIVDKFGFEVHQVTAILLLNHLANMAFAPLVGRLIHRFGERTALTIEYIGLIGVFAAYAMVEDPYWAGALYILDHLLFAMAFAQRTYLQKIADPDDIAPTSAVSFTINHIAAVFLPASLGYLYLVSPGSVFWLGAAMAATSLVLARLAPRHPAPGRETIFSQPTERASRPTPAE